VLLFGCLRIFAALDADGLARSLAGTGIRASALTADREAATMADATVAVDRLKALQILLEFAAKIAFDDKLVFLDNLNDAVQLLIGQLFSANVGVDFGLLENELGAGRSDAINIRQGGFDPFVTGDINTEKTWHMRVLRGLALTLFQARVLFVDDINAPLTANYLAVRGAAFY